MNLKTTYVMFGILGLLFAIVLGTLIFSGPSILGDNALFAAWSRDKVDPNKIDTVEITITDPEKGTPQKLVFIRKDASRWVMTEPKPTRVDGVLVDEIVRELLRAKTETTKDITTNLANHGLDKPTVSVTLKQGVDRSATVNLGYITIGGSNALVFVTTNDQPNKPRAVRKSSIASLFARADEAKEVKGNEAAYYAKTASDFRFLKLFDFALPTGADEATQITLKLGATELALARNGTQWLIDKPAGLGEADLDGGPPTVDNSITGVRPLLGQISSLAAATTADFITDPKPLAEYGLDAANPALLRISVTRKPIPPPGSEVDLKPITETVLIGKSIDAKNDRFYAIVEGDPSIVQIAGGPAIAAIRRVAETPILLRDKQFVRLTLPTVDAIQAISPAQTLEFFRIGTLPKWTLFEQSGSPESIAPAAVDQIVNELIEPRKISNFPAPGQTDAALGFDKPIAELKVWVQGIQPELAKPVDAGKPDPAKPAATKPKLAEQPTLRVLFGKIEGDFVYVRRILAGSKSPLDAIVPATLLRTVSRPRVEYLDPKLEGFDVTQVVAVKIDGKTVDNRPVAAEFSTDSKEAKTPAELTWKLTQIDGATDRIADPVKVANILASLSTLKPLKLIQDRATPDALAGYGLASTPPQSPLLRVTVRLRGEGPIQDRVFHFGNVAKDVASSVYAEQVGRNLVFVVSKTLIDQLTDANLMEMTLFRVDKTKIKSFIVRGWADLVGSVQTREFERKDNTWVIKGDAGYAIDPRKIDTFLEDLTNPKAESFVGFKTGAKPEQGLDVKTGALEIELKLDTPEPVTLTLGKADTFTPKVGGGAPVAVYFAMTNKLPGDVFFVLQDRFKSIREKPKVFAKE